MVHPRVRARQTRLADAADTRVPGGGGISQPWLRARIERALRDVQATETVPQALRERFGLAPLESTLRDLHQPRRRRCSAIGGQQEPLWRRIRFDELLAQQLTLREMRARRAQRHAPALRPTGDVQARLQAALPFKLTRAQLRVWSEIENDLGSGVPMHRLLQGDVAAARRWWQHSRPRVRSTRLPGGADGADGDSRRAALRRIEQWLAPLGVRVAWLTARSRWAREEQSTRRSPTARTAGGRHARAGAGRGEVRPSWLAIVDEQHRFGVAQRLALRDAAVAPHLLMLSATPIPRTLR